MSDNDKKIARRALLSTGLLAGVGGSVVAFPKLVAASSLQQGVPPGLVLSASPQVSRSYSALDAAGVPTHALLLEINMPVPDDGSLAATCWISQVKIHNLLPNAATGFQGGTLTQYAEGIDSTATFLMALDLAQSLLAASQEAQIGSVVWADIPMAANYGLPAGVANLPCTPLQPLAVTDGEDPQRSNNPRITHPCGGLNEVVLIRDLERTDALGGKTLVRIIFGMPQICQGPATNFISYSCTFQIQGLQASVGSDWPDGVVTVTGEGLDPIWALVTAMQMSLGALLATTEGSTPGTLIWLAAPSAPSWGLPRFDPNALTSSTNMATYLNALSPHERAEVEQLLAIDWVAYYN